MYCLLQCHKYRLINNWAQYEASTVPQHEPGGGGFSILRFNLDALYEQNQLCRNVWTKSNKNLPLVRYTGMSFKIYRPDDVDLVVKIQKLLSYVSYTAIIHKYSTSNSFNEQKQL